MYVSKKISESKPKLAFHAERQQFKEINQENYLM
jgi:hypothetical protein